MDFLLTYRITGTPKPVAQARPAGNEDFITLTVSDQFVLLTHRTVWNFFQYLGIIIGFGMSSFKITFPHKTELWSSLVFIAINLLFLIDCVSGFFLWVIWHRNQGDPSRTSTDLARFLWRNKAFKPRPMFFLVIDIVSLIPLELLHHAFEMGPAFHTVTYALPLLRLYRIGYMFVDRDLGFSTAFNVFYVLGKSLTLTIVLTHGMSCLWYLMQDEKKQTSLYVARDSIKFDVDNPLHWYLVSTYFVLTTFLNIGFGDITPKIDSERAFGFVIAITGFCLVNGYFIGGLSSVLVEQARRLTTLRLRLSLIQSELEERKVPAEVNQKILRYYIALWMTRKGAGATDEMLQMLPSSLSTQVYFDIFSPALNASLLLRSCDEYSQRALSRVMTINLYMAGDVILKRGEMNSQMFFIRKGTIQIMSYQDDETEIMTFGAGTVFGQCALLLSLPAKSEVHAATFCEIHMLSRRDLFHTLIDYPRAKEIVINVHKNLIMNMFADKFDEGGDHKVEARNMLTTSSFYKRPSETTKLGRDDVCIVTTFPYIFMPDTIFLKVWYIIQGILIAFICFFYPYCATFTRKYPVTMEAIVVMLDLIFAFDIYLTFFTAVNKENNLLSTGRQIARDKLRHISVFLDIYSLLPLHYFLPNDSRFKPVVLCVRCIRIYKIPLLFAKAEYNLNQTIISVLRLIKYILYFVLGCYVMGIIYYMQACFYVVCNPDSWYAKLPITSYMDQPVFISLYFSIMVLSGTGYGDITVACINDIIFVINFYLPGVLLFCYIVSEYSAHLSLAREPRLNFIELAARVNSFLAANKMLPSERIRVRQYLNLQWEKNMGYEFIYDRDLFYDTPSHLYSEINIHSETTGIHEMVLFKGLGENIINTILEASFRTTLPPHEVVIYAGELCTTLIIIEDGYCELTYGRDVAIKKIIGPGDSISTVELFLDLTAMYHVRTLTHCIIVKVLKSDIRRALLLNPVAARELELTITEFKQSPIAVNFSKARPIRLHLAIRPTMQNSVFRFRYFQKEGGNKELRDPYMALGICSCIRFFLRSMTVLPYGKLLKLWELIRCFFAFCSAILFPLLPYLQLQCPALYSIGLFLDFTAWIDLYFRFHVCYYNKQNILVTHPLRTCEHYIRGSFTADFIFCFPFDRIMYRRVYDSNGEASASDTSIDILRLLRVGQVHRIPATLMRLGQDFLSKPGLTLVLVMHTGFIIVYIVLLTSLLILFTTNYMVKADGSYRIVFRNVRIEEHMRKHLEKYGFEPEPATMFLMNSYWTGLTAFSVGFGDFSASTEGLMLYVIVIIVISYLYFNYVTIAIASHFSSINLNLTLYQKRLHHLIKFLKSENIEPLLKQHIINHFEFIWKKSRGMKTDLVFANFNLSLKDDVMLHLYEDTLREVRAFSQFDPSFFRILSSRLKEVYFQSGASVYKLGDIISQVNIIHQGEVTLVGKDVDEAYVLQRSKIFGHLGTGERGISPMSAVATKNLHILTISAVELTKLMESAQAKINETEGEEIAKTDENQDRGIASLSMPIGNNDSDDDEKNLKNLIERKRKWFLHSSYRFSEIINTFYMVVAYISANLVTFHFGFQKHHWIILGISIPIEVLYIIKIYIGFHTGYVDDTGEFVTNLKVIRARYMRVTGFYKDFFTLMPFEVFALLADEENRIFIATILRLTKLLRFYEVWFFFTSKADTLNVNMVLLKLIAMGIATTIMYHQCTCVWFAVLCPRANCPNSTTYNNMMIKAKCDYEYLCCLHFVNLILTATGYGDLTPQNAPEMMYVLFLAYLARIYAATFIGQMVSTVQKSLYARTKYSFETETLKGYLIANDVSPSLIKDILSYANNLWINAKGYQMPELLMDAPMYLVSEIKLAAYGYHINQNELFKKCNPNFRKHLVNEFRRTIYFPGNIIVHEGEVNGTAYFIHCGQVAYKTYSIDKGDKIHIIEKYFGMEQGIKKRPHYHTYFARSKCIILSLTKEDWEYLIDFYPRDVVRVYKEVELMRREKTRKH